MKYYDARIIEGCCVFSYAVEPPSHPAEENGRAVSSKQKETKKKKRALGAFWKKTALSILFLLLAPFAFAADMICLGTRKLADAFRTVVTECSHNKELAACILTALSSTAVIPFVLLLL